jgi:integrase
MPDLSRKRDRDRLAVREAPHYQRLEEGCYLAGFRAGAQTWLARCRDRDGKQHHKPLGQYLEYDDAKRRAEEWIGQMRGTAFRSAKRATVREALEAYVEDLRRHGRADSAKIAARRFATAVWNDPLAGIETESLAKDDMLAWRDRLRQGRTTTTINTVHVGLVIAGLNAALELGFVGNPLAWKMHSLEDDEQSEGTAVFLTPEQRRALIAAADEHGAAFLRAVDLTGARPGELLRANVEDFDGATVRLSHRKGRPPKWKIRYTVLTEQGIAHFTRAAADKLPKAPLFTRDGRLKWTPEAWCATFRAAIAAHNRDCAEDKRLPVGTGLYSFRHSRISELLQLHGVDPLTVAKQTGTSVAQIEKTYMKFIPSALQEKLAAVRDV